jgi:hypothetical protein
MEELKNLPELPEKRKEFLDKLKAKMEELRPSNSDKTEGQLRILAARELNVL